MIYKTLDDVKQAIEKGNDAAISKFWESYQQGLQHDTWIEDRKSEYLVLWPETESVPLFDENNNPIMLDDGKTQATEEVLIDYSNNPDYVTFDEWMQEREVLTGTHEVVQPDGSVVSEPYTYDGKLLREFAPSAVTAVVQELPEYNAMLKEKRDEDIANLTVTISSGKVFDADELSRQRMADAILASDFTAITSTEWKLANNSKVMVTLDELREAHALAIQALGAMVLA